MSAHNRAQHTHVSSSLLSPLPECDNPYDTRYKPERLLIYDKHPGGIGLCAAVSSLRLGACDLVSGWQAWPGQTTSTQKAKKGGS